MDFSDSLYAKNSPPDPRLAAFVANNGIAFRWIRNGSANINPLLTAAESSTSPWV